MEIRFYSAQMMLQGIMENQRSLLWTRKYFEPGNFELHAPVTDDNLRLTARGNLVWLKGYSEAGVIEDRTISDSRTSKEITAKGRFLSSYMDRRLIKTTVNFSGLVEDAMRQLLNSATAIPLVELGGKQGFLQEVSFQATYKNLLAYETKLAKSSGLGFRFRPDFTAKKIYFEVYEGKDRTLSQHMNSRVVFADEYDNLNSVTFRENDQLYKTVAYVGGEGEGADRTYVQVGSGSGLELREVFVDAKDLRSDGLTAEEYEAQLEQRGLEMLAENVVSSSFECETGAQVNFAYRIGYDLGDIVTVEKKAWGLREDLRITEIQEVYEHEKMIVVPTLGSALPGTIDWSE
jgi:hypothetical protein